MLVQGGIKYGDQSDEYSVPYKYPLIWELEKGAIVDGVSTNGALTGSQAGQFFGSYNNSTGNGSKITLTQTFWKVDLQSSQYLKDEAYLSIFKRYTAPGFVATRCADINTNGELGIYQLTQQGSLEFYKLYIAGGGTPMGPGALCPIVTLNKDIKIDFSTGTGKTNDAWNLKY